jgi:acyl carrier protein
VVAEKTGYPADMHSLEMELEGDLGIDSIKRVEILAAMQERFPGLPEVKATEMAAQRTLGQIVARNAPRPPRPSPRPKRARSRCGRVDATLERRAVVCVDAPARGATLSGCSTSGPVYVTEDGTHVGGALVARLRAAGLDARETEAPSRRRARGDLPRRAAPLRDAGRGARGERARSSGSRARWLRSSASAAGSSSCCTIPARRTPHGRRA